MIVILLIFFGGWLGGRFRWCGGCGGGREGRGKGQEGRRGRWRERAETKERRSGGVGDRSECIAVLAVSEDTCCSVLYLLPVDGKGFQELAVHTSPLPLLLAETTSSYFVQKSCSQEPR